MSQRPKSLESASMTAVGSELRLVELLPDYLNGHLSEKKQAEVESALAASSRMREQLEFQSQLQVALRAKAEMADSVAVTVADSRGSGFDAIAGRIVDSPLARVKNFFYQSWGGVAEHALIPAFALLLVVGFIASSSTSDSPVVLNEFETMIADVNYDQPTLLILPHSTVGSEEFAVLLHDYDLRLELHISESNMAEVTPFFADADIQAIVAGLKEDRRVRDAKALPVSALKE